MVGWGAPRGRPLTVEVVAIFGPTASGKTAIASRVADLLATEVVSADALQVYRGLRILTNQPDRPTRLVAIRDLDEEMSVGEYARLAHAAIDELVATRGAAVVAGGTGLYLRAALCDLEVPPAVAPECRRRLELAYETAPAATYARLRELDPAAAARIHPHDRRRVVRALELAEIGASLAPSRDRLWSGETRRPTLVVGLDLSPERLEARIRARTETMFERGVVEEVTRALERPISRTARQALGLREIHELPRDEALAAIVARTLRYAAYQRKWMRRIPGLVLVDADRPQEEVSRAIVDLAHAR
ncbi:MAG: tRNA (adenosine(37)-N6)-dimethylallyltransferase MiaA [Thermoleophilia bacterium]|nr:tRNA (adenosine(37)-N6)-dimethylallyltransferase MiaA [Gaiellaceae bacterium]MDW8339210.1 tRNA (adenosine(37)-N6)-dimethylallyltransferase MiaA [Thermoleophilia bacterium]